MSEAFLEDFLAEAEQLLPPWSLKAAMMDHGAQIALAATLREGLRHVVKVKIGGRHAHVVAQEAADRLREWAIKKGETIR